MNIHGDFIWYELMTTDVAAAASFYSDVVGWQVGDQPEYREIQTPHGHVGGILQITEEMTAGGARPAWLGYVQVDDVDKAAVSVEHGGGKLLMPPRDLPEAGRFGLVADPQGAAFYVMKPRPTAGNPDATSNAFAYDRPTDGHCAWNELVTSDPAAALHFYGTRFGWVKDGEMDMGPMGTYHFLRHGERGMTGAVMAKPPHMPTSAWTYYFRVPDIDAAAATIATRGGRVVHGPQEIPGGDFSMNAVDPQGAMFALVGKRN